MRNDEYARSNESFGLTTIRKKHIAHLGTRCAVFDFTGKSAKPWRFRVSDPSLLDLPYQLRASRHPGRQARGSPGTPTSTGAGSARQAALLTPEERSAWTASARTPAFERAVLAYVERRWRSRRA